jgi:hypothetical protein
MLDVKEFVEVATKMLYRECLRRGVIFDEDLQQEVLMWGWDAMKRLYNSEKGVKWTTYIWMVVDSVLKDKVWRRNKELRNISLEKMRENDDGEVRDWYLEDKREESFSSRLLKLLRKYWGLVGEDFLRLMVGDTDVSNALRSLSASQRRGEEWVEWWLGRGLTEAEKKCCQEIRELLREV